LTANARTSIAFRRRPRSAERTRAVHDQHDAFVRTRVHADKRPEVDRDAELFVGLAHGGLVHRLAEVDKAAGERPPALSGIEPAAQEDHPSPVVDRNDAGDRLGVVIGGVAALGAADPPREMNLGRLAAPGAEASVGQGGVQRRIHARDPTGVTHERRGGAAWSPDSDQVKRLGPTGVSEGASVVMTPTADRAPHGAEDREDGADDQHDDPEGPQDCDLRDQPDDQEHYSENDHETLLCVGGTSKRSTPRCRPTRRSSSTPPRA
jgi:hypothetical protein